MTVLQVEVDNAEALWHLPEKREYMGGDDMNARERQLPQRGGIECRVGAAHLARLDIRPPIQNILIVEEQIALGLAPTYQQQGIDVALAGLLVERGEVNVAQYVDIMDEYGFRVVE